MITKEELANNIPSMVKTEHTRIFLTNLEREMIAEVLLRKYIIQEGMPATEAACTGFCEECDGDPAECFLYGHCRQVAKED